MGLKTTLTIGVTLLVFARPGLLAQATGSQNDAQPGPVAVIGTTPISVAALDQAASNRLFFVRTQEYGVKARVLDELIDQNLIAREAAKRGVTQDDLLKIEVEGKAKPVTQEEIAALTESAKEIAAAIGSLPPAAVESKLRDQRLRQRRLAFLRELRQQYGVRVLLEPPRLTIDTEHAPSIGRPTAPITIVEFSDFQCPYCARAAAVVKQIVGHYGDKVRLVYKDFPLAIHKDAVRAAEAAACANDQGKFWDMHDKLFENQKNLLLSDMNRYAAELKLDGAAFSACMSSGAHSATVQKSKRDSDKYGITATPAFFVNGRFISGAIPYQGFADVVDEELRHYEDRQSRSLTMTPRVKR